MLRFLVVLSCLLPAAASADPFLLKVGDQLVAKDEKGKRLELMVEQDLGAQSVGKLYLVKRKGSKKRFLMGVVEDHSLWVQLDRLPLVVDEIIKPRSLGKGRFVRPVAGIYKVGKRGTFNFVQSRAVLYEYDGLSSRLWKHFPRLKLMRKPADFSKRISLVNKILNQMLALNQIIWEAGYVHTNLYKGSFFLSGEASDFFLTGRRKTHLILPQLLGTTASGKRPALTRVAYQAPELHLFRGVATPLSDVFSLGVVTAEMVTGKNPYSDFINDTQLSKELRLLENIKASQKKPRKFLPLPQEAVVLDRIEALYEKRVRQVFERNFRTLRRNAASLPETQRAKLDRVLRFVTAATEFSLESREARFGELFPQLQFYQDKVIVDWRILLSLRAPCGALAATR